MGKRGIVVASNNKQVCMDCEKTIKKGEEYYYHKRKDSKYIYCLECKKKPEHIRNKYDYDEILNYIKKNPLFIHQFTEKFMSRNSNETGKLIRRMMYNGYPIKIFRWSMRSRNSKIRENKKYRKAFQPNDFVIYYVEGTENRVVSKIMNEFEFDHIRWRDLLGSLYGKRIPTVMTNKETIMQWANQNVYN